MRKWVRLALTLYPVLGPLGHRAKKHRRHPERKTQVECFEDVKRIAAKANKRGFHAVFFEEGKENLPKGQVLFTCNHVSDFDPRAALCVIDRPIAFLSKKEVRKMPIFGWIVDYLGSTFIDRNDLRSEIKAFRAIKSQLETEKELSYFVFPEGTRSQGPEFNLDPYHAGTFKIAIHNQLPICPVVRYFPERVFNQHYHYHKYPIQVRYLKPIYPEEYNERTNQEIAQKVHDETLAALEERKKKDPRLVKELNGYSDKKLNKVLHYNKVTKKS